MVITLGYRKPDLATSAPETPDIAASTAGYARRFSGSVGEWFLDLQSELTLARLAEYGRPLRIVDVGGGHAQLVPPLTKAGHVVEVVGSAPQCAERLAPWLGTGTCTFRTASLLQLPYDDGAFDVAVSIRTLAHLRDWKRLVAELCRVARYGVIIDYATTQSLNVLADSLFALKLRVERNTRRFRVFSRSEVRSAFEQHGFRVTQMHPQFFLPMALHRAHGSAAFGRMLESVPQRLGMTGKLGSPILLHAQRSLTRAPLADIKPAE